MSDRPYPIGQTHEAQLAWDEAWKQRQRADYFEDAIQAERDLSAKRLSDSQFARDAKKLFDESFGEEREDALSVHVHADVFSFMNEFEALVCRHEGHRMTMDHCAKPEHDYCVRCGSQRQDITGFISQDCREGVSDE